MVLIKTNGDRFEITAPFHPELSRQAKRLGGAWRGVDVGWIFGLDHEAELRALCLRLWGVDGSPEAVADLVALRIEVDEQDLRNPIWQAHDEAVYLVGREIAASLRNRRAARPGRGVRFERGKPLCRAELNHFWTSIPNGSVFVLQDTPRMAIEHFEHAVAGHGRVQVVAAA